MRKPFIYNGLSVYFEFSASADSAIWASLEHKIRHIPGG
jgi:hypothetical protein